VDRAICGKIGILGLCCTMGENTQGAPLVNQGKAGHMRVLGGAAALNPSVAILSNTLQHYKKICFNCHQLTCSHLILLLLLLESY
jgi:hypothetical protein